MKSEYEIIDNAFDPEVFKDISDWVLSNTFPWFHQSMVAYPDEVENGNEPHITMWKFTSDEMSQEDIDLINKPLTPIQERYNFTETHIVYDNNEILTSRETWSKVQWVLTRINSKSLIRMKVNSYPRTEELVHHKDHFDLPYAHKGGILYFNANDGVTVLEDGTEVESVPNRILLFDSSKPHHSTTTTNANRRVNLNFNYF